ncbi:MAG: hypothetical protein RJA22_3292 [Verrucomicrobiota bacterium]
MNTPTDPQLLRDYVLHQSEDALTTLVERHFDLVYSTALRCLSGNHFQAQDVAQEVFRLFSLKAAHVEAKASLAGWFYTLTRAKAVDALRAEERRQAREQQVAAMTPLFADESDDPWKDVAPHLDDLLMELPETDREAVIQRYFKHKSFGEVADLLGTTEAAAQRRIHRAIERLRDLFERRGVKVSAGALGALLWANAVQAAPAGLAAGVAASLLAAKVAAVGAAGAVAGSAGSGLAAMAALRTVVAVGTLAGLVGVGLAVHEARQARQQRAMVEALQGQLAEQSDQHRREVDEARQQVAAEQELRRQFQARLVAESRLREQLARRGADLAAVNQVLATNAPESRAWMLRAAKLQERAGATPEMNTPELQWATVKDWLDASKNPLETEDDYQAAFSAVRSLVEGRFAGQVHQALQRHLAASGGRFPTQIEQLAAHFDPPLDPALLARWQVGRVEGDGVDELRIQLTAVDPARDVHWAVDVNGPRSSRVVEWR